MKSFWGSIFEIDGALETMLDEVGIEFRKGDATA
jgi:hypothetical protein